jgi:hypothetical protein
MTAPRFVRSTGPLLERFVAWSVLAALLGLPLVASALPDVEGFDLVSSVRTGRTTFNYTYTLRFQVDNQNYSGASFTVTSTKPATTVVQGNVPVGNLDAESFIRTKSTFTIQQDRTVPFDPTALHFAFAGTVAGVASGASNLQIGTVDFLVQAGRPLHEGNFPLQTANPVAGSTLFLRADVFGSVSSAAFRFVSPSNQTLAAGSMTMAPTSLTSVPRYLAAVVIPSQPFQIQITAVDPKGASTTRTSATMYTPSPFDIQIAPSSAEVPRGQTIPTQIVVRSVTARGQYNVSLLTPAGWANSAGAWTVTLTPGVASTINTTLTAPATGQPYTYYTLTAVVSPAGNAAQQQTANLKFTIE